MPRPPADLADRIKADIPKYLNVEAERERFSRSVGFNLRIAASIIVLLSSLAAVVFILNPEQESPVMSAARAPQAKGAAPGDMRTANTTASTDELRVEIVQTASPTAAQPLQMADASVAPPPVAGMRRVAPVETPVREEGVEAGVEGRVEGGIAGGVVGGVAGGVVSGVASEREDEVALAQPRPEFAPEPERYPAAVAPPPPLPAAAPPLPAAAPAPVPPPEPAVARKTAAETSLVPYAYASELSLAPKSVFGISVDPEVFRRIKTTIESGHRPSPAAVNVEALVNYFAGPPSRRVKSGVRLETEASPAPVDSNGHRGILRFTIDTAGVAVPAGGSVPPIAKDARIEIDFNRDAVERFQPIGDNASASQETALLHNLSVTGLYALDLKTPLKAKQRVATIRLRYRSVADGREHTIVREVRGSDFAKQWSGASRRHRLASLGALWGESLRSSSGGSDVAKRAAELASQEPKDERARELADVATASSGGGR